MLLVNAVMEKHMIQYDFLVDKFDLLIEVKRDVPPKLMIKLRSEGQSRLS